MKMLCFCVVFSLTLAYHLFESNQNWCSTMCSKMYMIMNMISTHDTVEKNVLQVIHKGSHSFNDVSIVCRTCINVTAIRSGLWNPSLEYNDFKIFLQYGTVAMVRSSKVQYWSLQFIIYTEVKLIPRSFLLVARSRF